MIGGKTKSVYLEATETTTHMFAEKITSRRLMEGRSISG